MISFSDIIHSPPPVTIGEATYKLSMNSLTESKSICGCSIELKGEISPFIAKDSPALDFISRILPVRPNKNILKAIAAVLSAVTGIEFRRHNKKSLNNIIQWFDLNLEALEPYAPYLIVETNSFANDSYVDEDDEEDIHFFNDPPENEQVNESANSTGNENETIDDNKITAVKNNSHIQNESNEIETKIEDNAAKKELVNLDNTESFNNYQNDH